MKQILSTDDLVVGQYYYLMDPESTRYDIQRCQNEFHRGIHFDNRLEAEQALGRFIIIPVPPLAEVMQGLE